MGKKSEVRKLKRKATKKITKRARKTISPKRPKPIRRKTIRKKSVNIKSHKSSKKKTLKKKKRLNKKSTRKLVPVKKRKRVGEISHYFGRVKAAVLKIEAPIKLGDTIEIVGQNLSYKQKVRSMQINRIPIEEARQGEEVGLEVNRDVSIGDVVFRIDE